MKHTQVDKYTIAWFKIADCVSRGEKERALGVYRLLSHSLNDDALARQLEADIYLSCNEQERAIALYRQAITLYKKSKRLVDAVAIYEHLIFLLPNDMSLRREIIMCYNDEPSLFSKIYHHSDHIVGSYIRDNKWQELEGFAQECDALHPIVHATIAQQIIVAVYRMSNKVETFVIYVENAARRLIAGGYMQLLQDLLDVIEPIDDELYKYILDSIDG